MKVSEMPAADRPRERLLAAGAAALSDVELLSLLLQNGHAGCGVTELAGRLLARFDGIGGLLSAEREQLMACPGMGSARFALLQAARELARRAARQRLDQTDLLSSPAETRRYLAHHYSGQQREVFTCLFLDSQHRVLRCEDLFLGTLDGAAVYPREVAVRALQYRAAAVILAHNHPSGVAQPSSADRRITERLVAALALLDVRVLDHVIMGRGEHCSFAEQGLL